MRRKRSIICSVISAAVLLLTACGIQDTTDISSAAKPMGEAGTWSIFIYLCGSNLETKMGAAGRNLDELLAAAVPGNVNVIVETGGAQRWRSHDISADSLNRYQVKNGELILLEALPNASMGDEQTFTDFLTYGVTYYPAEKMCVIIWDHGSGSIVRDGQSSLRKAWTAGELNLHRTTQVDMTVLPMQDKPSTIHGQ